MDFSVCVGDDTIGPSIHDCRGGFDFTLKFEMIVLSSLPSATFIALFLPRAWVLIRRPSTVGGSLFQHFKLAVMAIYAFLQLALLLWASVKSARLATLFITSSVLSFAAAMCMSILSFLEHARSPRPSSLLNSFLLLSTLFDVARTRSMWLSSRSYDDIVFVRIFTAATAWKAVVILLESHHKKRWIQWDPKIHSPEETVGLYGLGTYSWLSTLFLSGYKKILTISDLFALDKRLSSTTLQTFFSRNLRAADLRGHKNGLTKALVKTLKVPLLLPIIPRLTLMGLSFCQPLLLGALLKYLDEAEDKSTGYGLIGATVLIYAGIPVTSAFYWYFHERALVMLRACLGTAIYRATVQAQITATDDSPALTLMSSDVERVRMGFMQLHEFWATPIQVALACWLLERQLGAAFAAPIVLVVVCVVCSTALMRFIGPRQVAWMQAIQKRVGHTADVISNIKSLKMSGLATPVQESILELRDNELKVGGKFRSFIVGSVAIGFSPTLLAPVFTFAVTYRSMDVATIFTSLSYLLLLCEPLSTFFQTAPQLVAGLSCLQRIQDFLEKESRDDFRCSRQITISEKSASPRTGTAKLCAIEIIDGNFGWNLDKKDEFALKNINSKLPTGLTIIVGPVASGKSTFCCALLGETPVAQGKVFMDINFRKVGYCAQTPFLFNATIRDSIMGFSDVDEERYADVIEATMLTHDILSLPLGDMTRIGSNGLILSGGQKQRISIARALYLQCDLLIFDDILSGLDATTEEHLFNRVFGPNGLLRKRAASMILCTHSVRHLPSADYIIVLGDDGTIVEQGSFTDLTTSDKYVHQLGVVADTHDNRMSDTSIPPLSIESGDQSPRTNTGKPATKKAGVRDPTRITGDKAVFSHYCQSIGTFWVLNFVIFGVLCGFFFSFPTVWLKYWSEDVSSLHSKRSTSFYLGLYALFQCLALMTLVAEAAMGMLIIVKVAGKKLHTAALQTVVSAPLHFFTTTDAGVVTNLFSQDMSLIDGELPQALINTSLQAWIGVGSAAVVATSSPYIIISYPFFLAFVYVIQRFYLHTSRQLRLLDLEAKSPLYTNFMDTTKGVATFRAFGWTKDAISINNTLLDTSQRPAYLLSMVQRWLTFVLGMVVAIIALLVVVLSTQLRPNAGFTGASMVSLMSFGKTLASLVQMYTLLETSIGAVSRLKAFSETTVSENLPNEDENHVLPLSWPETGRIEIKDVSASYWQSDVVGPSTPEIALRDLTLTIEPGQKVAICGRTGSGKSSMILLLLRLLDPFPRCASNILIDGLPLHTLDRSVVRQRIITVPQEAVFFPDGASFRKNLDPLCAGTTEDCQAVLEAVGLRDHVDSHGGLEAAMASNTFSQGQKQLFSLARAVLHRRIRDAWHRTSSTTCTTLDNSVVGTGRGGVLLLDEVSSSVDLQTDRAMYEVVRREFQRYTVVMVSHRLDVIVEMFDQVLVMDAGRVVEQGAPTKVMEREGGWFRSLWLVGKTA